MMSGRLDVMQLVENMEGVLTSKELENLDREIRYFTKMLMALPQDFLTEAQINFISQFYIDRLKDNHRVISAVLEGYLRIVKMSHYNISNSGHFFTVLFREVPCQSQGRQDRYNIYCIFQKVMDKNLGYIKSMGPDFVYGVITSTDGERDRRNLMFLFNFLLKFLKEVSLGQMVEEMFELISCYYPIDFHPAPDDPAPVTRQDLADALCPCLCAVPEFGEQCLILLVEKLDSSLRLAKLDSLKLLKESCSTFKPETYGPFLKTLWASLHREISHKTDEELKMAAHETLSTLVSKLATVSNTDQGFETFLKGILVSMQTAIADSSTVAHFVQASKVLLTTANASKESCFLVIKSMIPAIITYYGFKITPKLQIASLEFLGDLYEIAVRWEVTDSLVSELNEIPQLCLAAVSQMSKEFQMAGFKTLVKVKNTLQSDLGLFLIDFLVHNIKHSQDKDLASLSVAVMNELMSNACLYSNEKLMKIERDYGLIDCVLSWVTSELQTGSQEALSPGLMLIADIMSRLPVEEQQKLLSKHTDNILKNMENDESYFHVLCSLYISLHQTVHTSSFENILNIALTLSLRSNDEAIRTKACVLVAHFFNKVEHGLNFDILFETLQDFLMYKTDRTEMARRIILCGWLAKALSMSGNYTFSMWFRTVTQKILDEPYQSCETIRLIMTDFPDYLNRRYHCRSALLFKQRLYDNYKYVMEDYSSSRYETREYFLLGWAYILEKVPKTLLNNDVEMITYVIVESFDFDNEKIELVMLDILCYFIQEKHDTVAQRLQTVLPKLLEMSYLNSMDVRIKSLQCLYETVNSYHASLLLPYKQEVLSELAPLLEHSDQRLRNMAVEAHARWLVLGGRIQQG